MLTKKTLLLLLTLCACSFYILYTSLRRETIFDHIIHIPKSIQLAIPYLPPLCDEIPGLKKSFIAISKGTLYCEEEGNDTKPALVLINGGPGGTHHVFHPYFSQLKEHAHIIYYDQRGTGKSSEDPSGKTYTIKQAIEDLESLRKALNIDTWFVLGWSYGGLLAQCYALSYPNRCAGLILVNTEPGLTHTTFKPSRQHMFISQKEQEAINKVITAFKAKTITESQAIYNINIFGDWKRQHYYRPIRTEIIRSALYEWSPAPKFRKYIIKDMQKNSLDHRFDNFQIPTLLCEAEWDLTWDTDKAKIMKENHPRATYINFEKSGHKLFADEPDKFFSVLKNFIK